jgi:hypothetical protein
MTMPTANIVSLLEKAAAIVDAANLPPELRASAFRIAAEQLGDDVRSDTRGREPEQKGTGGLPPEAGKDEAINLIAKKLATDVKQVARVFDVDDQGVHLQVTRTALDKSKATAMREVLQLVVAARQALGEEWTPINDVRAVAEGRGVLDSKNWSAAVKSLDGDGFRFRGSSQAREAKINQVAYEAAAALVARVSAGG